MSSGNDKEIRIGIAAETSGADEARKALEGVRRAAEEAAAASSEVKPLSEGGGARVDAKAVEEVTEAILEQVEANGVLIDSLDELTDAEAGVVRSTGKVSEEFKKLSEEGKKPDGFGKLFSPERMEGIKGSFQDLGRAVGDFAKEFAKTEEGKKLLEGLPEEVQVFGETALKVTDGVAKGFSQGGPIGGAVAGLTALIQHVGKEYLDAQERIAASDREWEDAQAKHTQMLQDKARAAAEAGIAERTEDENERLKDQNDILKENADLMRSRRDLADSEFELKQAKERAGGKPEEVLEAERVQHDLKRKEAETTEGERQRLEERKSIQVRGFRAREEAARIEKTTGFGNQSKEYKDQMAIAEEADEEYAERKRTDAGLDKQGRNELEAARNRGQARLIGLDDRRKNRELDERRRQQAAEKRRSEESGRLRERGEKDEEREEERVRGIGRDADGISSKAAGIAEKRLGKGKGVEALDKIGAALRDDPTAKELESLTKLLTQLAGALGNNGGRDSRAIGDLQKEVRDLQGQLKKGGSVRHS